MTNEPGTTKRKPRAAAAPPPPPPPLPIITLHGGNLIQTDDTSALMVALAAAQGDMSGTGKSGKNPHHKNEYSTISDVQNMARPVLSRHGIAWLVYYADAIVGDRILNYMINRLAHGASGQFFETRTMMPHDPNPQRQGSNITYFRRYTAMSLLGLAPAEDDDGNMGAAGHNQRKQIDALQRQVATLQAEARQGMATVAELQGKLQQAGKQAKRGADSPQAGNGGGGSSATSNGPQSASKAARNAGTQRRSSKHAPITAANVDEALEHVGMDRDGVEFLRVVLGRPALDDPAVDDFRRGGVVARLAGSASQQFYARNGRAALEDMDPAEQLGSLLANVRQRLAHRHNALTSSGTVPNELVQLAAQALPVDQCDDFDLMCKVSDAVSDLLAERGIVMHTG